MKIVVSGGGTGGHIYPATSLIHYLKAEHPETEFLYVGTEKGLESRIVPAEGIPFKTIDIQGFKRSLSLDNVKTVYLFLKSVKEAKKMLRAFQPDVVIGTGGYVSGAVIYAASKLNLPTIIHEQNSVAGMTNKFLSRYVDRIGICFPDAATYFPEKKVSLVGNPRAQEVAHLNSSNVLKEYGLDPEKETVLIFGGSRGAMTINKAVLNSLRVLEDKEYQTLYVSGNSYFEGIKSSTEYCNLMGSQVVVVPYINNMADVMANVTLVVGRAGATSLAEITALGLPSVLIPSPNVTDDHQTKNAMSLVNKGAAMLIKDDDLTTTSLVEAIDGIMLNKDVKNDMAIASKGEGIPDATERLYQLVMELTSKERS